MMIEPSTDGTTWAAFLVVKLINFIHSPQQLARKYPLLEGYIELLNTQHEELLVQSCVLKMK